MQGRTPYLRSTQVRRPSLHRDSYGPVTVARSGQVTFLRPAVLGDELVARATERGRFGRNGIYDVTVSRTDGVVIAEFRGQRRQTQT
jgi:acyl-CoA thioesterase